jgi:hypothetical protein
MHDRTTALWHVAPAQESALAAPPNDVTDDIDHLLERQHLANFFLWHEEDKARAPHASPDDIAAVKRNIDRLNQQRHDATEMLDSRLLEELAHDKLPNPNAELNSETPGMMTDRLSILALKIFHTQEEIARPGAPAGHAQRNYGRMAVLKAQRHDLEACLDRLWKQVRRGERRFQLYRQLKMYNDPTLNPAVYGKRD